MNVLECNEEAGGSNARKIETEWSKGDGVRFLMTREMKREPGHYWLRPSLTPCILNSSS